MSEFAPMLGPKLTSASTKVWLTGHQHFHLNLRLRRKNSPGHLATLITARNLFIISLSFSLNLRLDENIPPTVCEQILIGLCK